MSHIHLKSLKREKPSNFPEKFAILLRPKLEVGELQDSEDLYLRVRQNGGATLILKDLLFNLIGEPISLTPQDFEREWEGD